MTRFATRTASAAVILLALSSAVHAAGALAIGACAAYGHAFDYPRIEDARKAAFAQCGANCKVVAVTRRGCLAYAIDGHNPCGPHGYASGARLGAAQNEALKLCFGFGGKDCVIRAFACDGKG